MIEIKFQKFEIPLIPIFTSEAKYSEENIKLDYTPEEWTYDENNTKEILQSLRFVYTRREDIQVVNQVTSVVYKYYVPQI